MDSEKPKKKLSPLSAYIKARRREYGLTQADMAWRAGVGLRFVRDLEQGKTTLRLDKVNDVLALFGREAGPVPMNRSTITDL